MLERASGISAIMASAASHHDGSGPARPKKPAKTRAKKPAAEDERDPAVVAVQQGPCGFCGDTGHGFNDCPKNRTVGEPEVEAPQVPAPLKNGQALAAAAYFHKGWLRLPKDLPFETYREMVVGFSDLHKNMLWIVGDLQVQGQQLYGEQYSQILDVLATREYTESTLSVAKTLSEKFPPDERVVGVSWNHHLLVQNMSKKDRKFWLERAAAEGLSTREMKAQILAGEGAPKAKAKPEPPAEPEATPVAEAEPVVEADEPEPAVGVKATGPGVSAALLARADAADRAFFEALDDAQKALQERGVVDLDALREPSRDLAEVLYELIKALG